MRNGATRPAEPIVTRRDVAPRVHALRDAVVEALWGDYDADLCDTLRRIDNILLWQCWNGEEVSQDVEDYVVGLLWQSALVREAA